MLVVVEMRFSIGVRREPECGQSSLSSASVERNQEGVVNGASVSVGLEETRRA